MEWMTKGSKKFPDSNAQKAFENGNQNNQITIHQGSKIGKEIEGRIVL